ncbi:hypothetical protein [Nonlabens ponticola]|uniref:Uncharacterized protein n=1 Tax=Nonlabens ponticola TaxID=2496866 RepID=A0A3S9MVR5_9FLAO|nr:hypothetical protein [Nonlabens ponticola]AZQ43224.1 hypothetical protein EJ995_02855 [Nonlabens ponticola]
MNLISFSDYVLERASAKNDYTLLLLYSQSKNILDRKYSIKFLMPHIESSSLLRKRVIEMYKNDLDFVRLEIASKLKDLPGSTISIPNIDAEFLSIKKSLDLERLRLSGRSFNSISKGNRKVSERLNEKFKQQQRLPYGG